MGYPEPQRKYITWTFRVCICVHWKCRGFYMITIFLWDLYMLRARMNYLIREIIKVLPIIVILIIIFKAYGLISLFLELYPFIIGHFRYDASGWNIYEQQLALSYRSFLKHTIYEEKSDSIARSVINMASEKKAISIHSFNGEINWFRNENECTLFIRIRCRNYF